MISKNLSRKKTFDQFLAEARHLGIAIDSSAVMNTQTYIDLEGFFLAATYNLISSRLAEGVLCWLLRYGHLLSPSKTRRLILSGAFFDRSVLGGFVSLMKEHKINPRQWNILSPFMKKNHELKILLNGPRPRKPNPHFEKFNVIVHSFQMDQDKFLLPTNAVVKKCIELKNRALFGSVVHSDVASYLHWHPEATPYEIAKATVNHKARVFEIFQDIKLAL